MYNYNHLYYFYIAAKSGGVNAAAKHLLVSQPSLSSQIKVLERSLDVRLFHKVGRNNELTPEGQVIFGYCRQMFEISEEMNELITSKVPSAARRIHIGVSNEIDRPFVVEVVSHFLGKHGLAQRPKVTVVSGSHEQLAERLRFRELDAVVTPTVMIDPDLENIEKTEVPVALVCSTKWKQNKEQNEMPVAQAIKEIFGKDGSYWLMPSPHFKLRSETDLYFENNHIKGRIVFESDVISSLVRSVIDGIGIAFLPKIYVSRELREKTISIIGQKDDHWRYKVYLTCHNQNKENNLIKSLSLSFKEVCNKSIE